jgi:hypothetical protein
MTPTSSPAAVVRPANGRPKKLNSTTGRSRFVALNVGSRQRISSSLRVWASSTRASGAVAGDAVSGAVAPVVTALTAARSRAR